MDYAGGGLSPGRTALPILRSLWQFRRFLVAATLASALLGWGLSALQPERYEATAEMLLTDPRNAGLFRDVRPGTTDPVRYVRNQAQRIRSTAVAARTVSLLEDAVTVDEVREGVEATPSAELDLITVMASGSTGKEAAALANAVIRAYREVMAEEVAQSTEEAATELRTALGQLEARVSASQGLLAASPGDEVAALQLDADVRELLATQQLIERLAIDASLYGSGVELVEPAVEPDEPVAPRTLRNTLMVALLGFGAVAAFKVWRGDALRRVDHRHEPQEVLGVPLLGTVPDLGDLVGEAAYPTLSEPDSPAAEAYRFAAAAMETRLGLHLRSIVVTSAGAGDGKTTVALNLAVALQKDTRKVLIIDADTRTRSLSRLTGTENLRGLTDMVEGGKMLTESIHDWPPGAGPKVAVSPVGRRHVDPAAFFRTVRYRSVLGLLRQESYLSVIDSPPLLAVSDASAIAGSADVIVLVVSRGTPFRTLEDLHERLAFVGTPVLGYVFNRASERRHGYGYGYGHLQTPPEANDDSSTGDMAELGVMPHVPAPPAEVNEAPGDGMRARRRGPRGSRKR